MNEIRDAGADVLAVSVDSVEESARLASGLGLEFPLLSDAQRTAIADWRVVHEGGRPGGGAIARPAAFLVEPDGTISWRHLPDDWRVRLRPEQVLEALATRR